MIPALAQTPVIETARLVLRAPMRGDFEPCAAFFASDRAGFVGGPIDRGLAWRAVCHLTGHWVHRGYGMFIFHAKDDPSPLGMAGPWFPEGWPEPEIGWSVFGAAAEGRGYAHEAASAARDFAWRNLGWTTAVSYIDPRNDRSIALARRLGAVRDDTATSPGDGGDHVYRHPAPEARA